MVLFFLPYLKLSGHPIRLDLIDNLPFSPRFYFPLRSSCTRHVCPLREKSPGKRHDVTWLCISMNRKGNMHQTQPSQQEPSEELLPAGEVVEQLVHDYSKLVFHVIYALTSDWSHSEDLVQETFMQALLSIDAARAATGPRFQARAWLLRIAVNRVRMHQRRARLYRFVPFSVMEDEQETEAETSGETVAAKAAPVQPPGYASPEPADPAELVAERDAVERTLAKLPENQRLPLLLSIVAGCSNTEIARILDLEEATVRQRLSRARRAFQHLYAEESGEVIRAATQDQRESTHSREVHRSALQVAMGL